MDKAQSAIIPKINGDQQALQQGAAMTCSLDSVGGVLRLLAHQDPMLYGGGD